MFRQLSMLFHVIRLQLCIQMHRVDRAKICLCRLILRTLTIIHIYVLLLKGINRNKSLLCNNSIKANTNSISSGTCKREHNKAAKTLRRKTHVHVCVHMNRAQTGPDDKNNNHAASNGAPRDELAMKQAGTPGVNRAFTGDTLQHD